jgi:hypothetical protein
MIPAEFDSLAHEVEGKLRELRHLVAETVILTDDQEESLGRLVQALQAAQAVSDTLRRSLLGQDDDRTP